MVVISFVMHNELLMNLRRCDWNLELFGRGPSLCGVTTSLALISNTRKLNPQRTLWSSNLHLLGFIFLFLFLFSFYWRMSTRIAVGRARWIQKFYYVVYFHESLFLQSESVSSVSSKTIMVYSVAVLSSSRTSRKSHNLQWKKTPLSGPLSFELVIQCKKKNPNPVTLLTIETTIHKTVKIEVWECYRIPSTAFTVHLPVGPHDLRFPLWSITMS